MKLPITIIALLLSLANLSAATYRVGDIVTNFTLIARHPFTNDTGQSFDANAPVHLTDFAGRIVFVQFFAVWWAFCVAAAGRTVPEIREYYKNRGGNAHGLPVLHVAVNAEDAPFFWYATEDMIGEHGFDPVCNDYVRTNDVTARDGFVRLQFQPDWQRPVFLAINCVSNSPSHPQWQLLVNHGGYDDASLMNDINQWRAIIDSVRAPPPRVTQPVVSSGEAQFTVPGQRGQTNRLESSSDLLTWSAVTNLIGTNAPVTLRDPITGPGPRFYRVVRP